MIGLHKNRFLCVPMSGWVLVETTVNNNEGVKNQEVTAAG